MLRLSSVAVAAFNVYVLYFLGVHLYEYITTVHSEPDEVLLVFSLYGLSLLLKAIISGYGYHFATEHTERTPENVKSFFSFLGIALGFNLIVTVVMHKLASMHISMYNNSVFATHGPNSLQHGSLLHSYIGFGLFVMKLQVAGFAGYYMLWRSLYKKEASEPKIVDTMAASIKYQASN